MGTKLVAALLPLACLLAGAFLFPAQTALADDSPSPAFPQLQVLSLGGDDPSPLTLEAQVGKKPLHATPQGTQLVAWGRFAGKTALGTMQQVSSAGWSKSDTVVVATV